MNATLKTLLISAVAGAAWGAANTIWTRITGDPNALAESVILSGIVNLTLLIASDSPKVSILRMIGISAAAGAVWGATNSIWTRIFGDPNSLTELVAMFGIVFVAIQAANKPTKGKTAPLTDE